MQGSGNLKVVQPHGKTVWQFLVKTKCIITTHACSIASVVSDSLQGLQPARLLCPWVSPGKNTGVNCHALLRGSSLRRDWTQVSYVSCTARQVLHHWCHLGSPSIYTTICKIGSQWKLAVWLRELTLGLCNNLERWEGWQVRGRFKREETSVQLWQIHFDVQQKSNIVKQLFFN